MILEKFLETIKYELVDAESGGFYHIPTGKGNVKKIIITGFNSRLTFEEHIGGCGILNFAGNSTLSTDQIPDIKKLFKFLKKNGIGAINCILGQHHYTNQQNTEQILLDIGFEIAAEYNNWQHGLNYKQRLYIIQLK